ncbi:hypothetical protein PG999_005550 [Apiospora kogelbergensis]|uniref:FAD-binding PCMH-type domain-containing protein n=1 Tax=Apiospora kogelbergensis TaxID=1337665 RepID=A0AAW0R2J5_9PEZI
MLISGAFLQALSLGRIASTTASTSACNWADLFASNLSSGATIVEASDPHFSAKVAQRWTTHGAPSICGAIQPATAEDVEKIVKIATSHDIPILATGGGHGMSSTLANMQHGAQVDLARLNNIDFDRDSGSLTIGPGVKFSDVIDMLYSSGYQFPVGTAYCVGVIGASLGGGVSAGQGIMGLLSDLMQSVQIVTAAGDSIEASRTINPDLFWALRGAGANFGIVTSATYRVPRFINGGKVVNANYMYPASMSHSVFELLASFDDELAGGLAFNIATFYNPQVDQVVIIVNANYHGTMSEAMDLLEPFLELGPVDSQHLYVSWPEVFSTSYFGIDDKKACGRNQHVNMYSIAAIRTDADALSAFVDQLSAFSRLHPDVATTFVVHRFATQAVLGTLDDDSAYPYRDLKMHM